MYGGAARSLDETSNLIEWRIGGFYLTAIVSIVIEIFL